jgi:hypothetical protein
MRALTLTRLDAKGEKGVQPLTAAEDEQARINADATRRARKGDEEDDSRDADEMGPRPCRLFPWLLPSSFPPTRGVLVSPLDPFLLGSA